MSPVGLLALSFYRLQRDCEVIIFDSLKKKKNPSSELCSVFKLKKKRALCQGNTPKGTKPKTPRWLCAAVTHSGHPLIGCVQLWQPLVWNAEGDLLKVFRDMIVGYKEMSSIISSFYPLKVEVSRAYSPGPKCRQMRESGDPRGRAPPALLATRGRRRGDNNINRCHWNHLKKYLRQKT